ncbi:unnamed protein product, partial [Choristocarpus tenellus]
MRSLEEEEEEEEEQKDGKSVTVLGVELRSKPFQRQEVEVGERKTLVGGAQGVVFGIGGSARGESASGVEAVIGTKRGIWTGRESGAGGEMEVEVEIDVKDLSPRVVVGGVSAIG